MPKASTIKAKIDTMQQNSKCRLYIKRDETVNHSVSKRHDWVGKVIQWELCKKLRFDHTTKWYVHKPESVLENATIKFFGTLRYELITYPGRKPDLVLINKKRKLAV